MNNLFEKYNAAYNVEVLKKLYNHSLNLGEPLHYYNMLVDINGNKLGNLFWFKFDDNHLAPIVRRKDSSPFAGEIYKIENTINNKIYIGQTEDIYKRKSTHVRKLYDGSHENSCLQMDFYIYGMKSFIFEIVEQVEDFKNLLIKEEFWIQKYNGEYPLRYNAPIKGSNRKEYSKRLSKEFAKKYKASTLEEKENMKNILKELQ